MKPIRSTVNNCPSCGRTLWLRRSKGRTFYNCIGCGYEADITLYDRITKQKVETAHTEQLSFAFGDDTTSGLA